MKQHFKADSGLSKILKFGYLLLCIREFIPIAATTMTKAILFLKIKIQATKNPYCLLH